MPTSTSVPEMMHNVGNQDKNQNKQTSNHQRKLSNSLNGIDQQYHIQNHQKAENEISPSNAPTAPVQTPTKDVDQTFPNGGNYVAPDYDNQSSQQELNTSSKGVVSVDVKGVRADDDDDAMPPPPPPPPIWDDGEPSVMNG